MNERIIDKKVCGKLVHSYVYGGGLIESNDYEEKIERNTAKNLIAEVKDFFNDKDKDKYFAIWKIEYVLLKINGKNRKLFNKKMLLRKNSYIVDEVVKILKVSNENYLVINYDNENTEEKDK